MISVGIGCRKGCSAEEIVALVRDTLAKLAPGLESLGLFSIAAKRDEPGLSQAAAALGWPLTFFEVDELRAFADGASHVSAQVTALHGLPSVAETAALAGAGIGAVLCVTRRTSARATCAVAGLPIRRSSP